MYRVGKKKCVLGCVISPLHQQAESRNLGQTFLANSVLLLPLPLRLRCADDLQSSAMILMQSWVMDAPKQEARSCKYHVRSPSRLGGWRTTYHGTKKRSCASKPTQNIVILLSPAPVLLSCWETKERMSEAACLDVVC